MAKVRIIFDFPSYIHSHMYTYTHIYMYIIYSQTLISPGSVQQIMLML